jgi:hypothetical protein
MKFSVRDLLLVTVIVALALGWAIDHSQAINREAHWRQMAVDAAFRLAGIIDKPVELVTPNGERTFVRAQR